MTVVSAFARSVEQCQASLAASATFAAEGGTLAHVHTGDVDFSNQTAYPRPLIMLEPKQIRPQRDAGGFKNFYTEEGLIFVTMVRNTPTTLIGNPNAAAMNHYEFFGKVRDEFNSLSGDGSSGDGFDGEMEIIDCGKPMAEDMALLGECFLCIGRVWWGNAHGRRR